MAKIIVNCRYLKGSSKAQRSNLIEYMGTRPGVEFSEDDSYRLNFATERQTGLIKQLEQLIPNFKTYFEYEDYIKNPTIENASALITAAYEYNLDLFSTKENLIEYMGKRPGSERVGEHGLFDGGSNPVDIREAMDEVANHEGNVWTHVVSLRRDDAERLGYNNQAMWKNLAVSQISTMIKAMKISGENLKWYAAFHNEGHHPHMHMVVFSEDQRSGYLSKRGIEKIRSGFAHEIFKQDFYQIYDQKKVFDQNLTQYSRDKMQTLIAEINADQSPHPMLENLLLDLAKDLRDAKGKKQYGWLPKDMKQKVDRIVKELAADPRIAELYRGWCECQNEIARTYKFDVDAPPPLEKQPEFRSIHNAVITAALQLNTEQAAPTIVTVPNSDGDFFMPKNKNTKEDILHAAQEQKRNEDKIVQPSPVSPQETEKQEQAERQNRSAAIQSNTQNTSVEQRENISPGLTSPAAMSVTRLLKSLGNNIYGSYNNGYNKLPVYTDRKQLQKQAQKKAAQGHQMDDLEQKQY